MKHNFSYNMVFSNLLFYHDYSSLTFSFIRNAGMTGMVAVGSGASY